MQSASVVIRTYCYRNIIEFYKGNHSISLLKKMLSVNPKQFKEESPDVFFSHDIGEKITAVTILIYSGLSLQLVRDIVNVVDQYDFVKHVAFVLIPENDDNLTTTKSFINASAKCMVYNDDIEGYKAAYILSQNRQQLIKFQ